MPLPKPPARPGDLLDATVFEALAPPKAAALLSKPRAAPAPKPSTAPAQAEQPLAAAGAGSTASTRSAASAARAPEPAAPHGLGKPGARAPVAAPAAPASPPPKAAEQRVRKTRRSPSEGPAKLFVLDTNVLMHDPTSLFRFEEHDVFLPMITLEELDNHKRGMSEVARNARQVSRELDALVNVSNATNAAARPGSLAVSEPLAGIALAATGHREAAGTLYFQTTLLEIQLPAGLPQGKADNQILGVVKSLREQEAARPATQGGPRDVVLVSKDINMRVKAGALGLAA